MRAPNVWMAAARSPRPPPTGDKPRARVRVLSIALLTRPITSSTSRLAAEFSRCSCAATPRKIKGITVRARLVQLESRRYAAHQRLLVDLLEAGTNPLGNEIQESAAEHVFGAIRSEGPIHETDMQGLVQQKQPIRGVFGDRAQNGFRLPDRSLRDGADHVGHGLG